LKKVRRVILLIAVLLVAGAAAVIVNQSLSPKYQNVVVSGTFSIEVCDIVGPSSETQCNSNSMQLVDVRFAPQGPGPVITADFTDGNYNVTLPNRVTYTVYLDYLNFPENNPVAGGCQAATLALNVQSNTYNWNHSVHIQTNSYESGSPNSNGSCEG